MNKDLVAKIVTSVLAATNLEADRQQIYAIAKQRIRTRVVDQVPMELIQISMNNNPDWFRWLDTVYIGNKNTWSPWFIMYDGPNPHDVHRLCHVPVDPPVVTFDNHKPNLRAEDFADLTTLATEWANKREKLTSELRAVLFSFNTVEKLLEKLPEFTRHVPPAAAPKPKYPLVAPNNILSALSKLGFDTAVVAPPPKAP